MTNEQTLWFYLGIIALSCVLCMLVQLSKGYVRTKTIALKGIYNTVNLRLNKKWMIVLAFMPMILAAGFRYFTGADYQQYVWSFERTVRSNSALNMYVYAEEPIYQLSKFVVYKLFGTNPTNWFMTMAVLTFINIIYALDDFEGEPKYEWFAVLFGLYTYLHMFNYVRQIYAASLILIGVSKLLKGKKTLFFIAVILATMVHRSSVAFLILPIINHYQNSLNKIAFKTIMIVSPLFMTLIGRGLGRISFFARYFIYFEGGFNLGFGWLIDTIPIIFILLIAEYIYKPNSNVLSAIYFSWLIIPFRSISYFAYAAGRLYLNISLIAIAAFSVAKNHSERKNKLVDISIIVIFIAYFMFEFYYSNNSEVFPYQSIWRM